MTQNNEKPTKVYKVAHFVSHPVQYQAPLYRFIATQKDFDFNVFFLSDFSLEPYLDTEFNSAIKWDTPLLDGYNTFVLDSTFEQGQFTYNNPNVKIRSVLNALRKKPWDAVWIHGYHNLAFMAILGFCIIKRIPILLRGDSFLKSTSRGLIKNTLVRLLLRQCSGLLYVGSANRDYYRHFGARHSQLFSVPYAVDNAFFQQASQSAEVPNDIAASDKTIILYASKFIQRKNPLLLLQAFAGLPSALRDQAELWFIGDGEQRPALESYIASSGLQNQVKILGFKNQRELPGYFSQCDLFVLPSEKEPFGLIINEVMNAGKAILTTDEVGAEADLVKDGLNGWVVRAGCESALRNALKEALNNPQQLSSMGKESLKIISKWGFAEDVTGIRNALQAVSRS